MSLISLPPAEFGEGLALGPKLHELQESHCTKRIAELLAKVERLRMELRDAEKELQYEQTRWPEVGEFVRCPLTGFFGQVTKVTPRAYGRPWVEILLYLGNDMPGHATIDLFANWELMDPPSATGQES
ncbi:hypothetical protein [Microvirga makkahensis]|uniref:Uncharacterized protein n=1 Tax=Microvirga makkahensis TaxID=1128670 RepID=A0A7X3SPS2_9HYPH|nr:hypothetical protein [Microvirga makkahensis]MXQ12498.1 hypothetical protein [Microvirga makkahensis]